MTSKPISIRILMFGGQIILACVYGLLGSIMTVLLCLRLGREKFFRRVERPKPPMQASDPIHGTHDTIKLKSSGVTLHYVSKGSPSQPMILFVHGFPECWYAWRYQMAYFSKNYRVVAIDQRGYGLSSKPEHVKDYKVEVLARDIVDVIEQLGHKSCVLVGHDWGGIVAWSTAILYPNLIEKLIIMNCPHPAAFLNNLSLTQLRRSWYIFFYQTPYIPELLLKANDFAMFTRVFYDKPMGLTNQNNITRDDLEVFKYTFSQKGATEAAVNYYRALFRYQRDDSPTHVNPPVLILWGCQDAALGQELADASQIYCSDVRLKKIPHASHWIQQDEPDKVNKYMETFLNDN